MRVAYIEDNPTNLALVERVAGMNRHTIVSFSEGEIAMHQLLKETFDLILMDVELAGEMGGLDVVRHLRTNGLKTPIIAVTAYAMMGDRERCLEAGCNGYLPKPLPIGELVALFAKYASEGATVANSADVAAVTPVPVMPHAPSVAAVDAAISPTSPTLDTASDAAANTEKNIETAEKTVDKPLQPEVLPAVATSVESPSVSIMPVAPAASTTIALANSSPETVTSGSPVDATLTNKEDISKQAENSDRAF